MFEYPELAKRVEKHWHNLEGGRGDFVALAVELDVG
jgi:hypothetical protein